MRKRSIPRLSILLLEVEQGRQCERDHTIRICVEEEPAYGRFKTEYTHRERERERGTKNVYIHENGQ